MQPTRMLNILVVEDTPNLRASYEVLFRAAAEDSSLIANVESFEDSDSAARRISQNDALAFDLICTDINLNHGGATEKNENGYEFAKLAKQILSDVPIIGWSAQDLGIEKRKIFDHYFSKDLPPIEVENMFSMGINLAKKHQSKHILYSPVTDREFIVAGYELEVLRPTDERSLAKPLSIWHRENDGAHEIEVFDCPALFSWGSSKTEAVEALIALIESYRTLLLEDDSALTPDILRAKKLLLSVMNIEGAHS